MKKIFLSASILSLIALASCGKKEVLTDTVGAVPAKLVNTEAVTPTTADSLSSAEIINQDLENLTQDVQDAAADNLEEKAEDLENLKDEAKEAVNEKIQEGKDAVAEKLNHAGDKAHEAAERLEE